MKIYSLILLLLVVNGLPLSADEGDRVLFGFEEEEAAKAWQTVNDGVMGGRSEGSFRISEANKMEFFGTLSLENNGGFASVRSRDATLGLSEGDSIVLRARGDGREYNLNLYVPRNIGRNSYRQSFTTKQDQWMEITLPLEKFGATWRGRVFPNQRISPSQITGVGIQISDKQAGPFKLEVEWINARSGANAGSSVMVQRDIEYVNQGHQRQKLDVSYPAEGKDHPIVVWIHGGGWRQGDKAGVQGKPEWFVNNGFVFVSVNYRFVPDVTVKEMSGDIAKAIKWIRGHADEYRGAPDAIFVMGHSAGAHLAALVCTDDRYLKAEGLSLDDIQGCVPVDTAAYDVAGQVADIGPLRRSTYTSVFGKDEKSQKDISPITHVAEGKGIPPFLILHVADRADSTSRSRAFADTLRKAGVDVRLFAAEGKNHGSINREIGFPNDPPTKAILDFVKGAL